MRTNHTILLFLTIPLFGILAACGTSPINSLSPPKNEEAKKAGWLTEYWSKQEHYSEAPSDLYNTQMLVIEADSFSVNRWFKKISVKPYAHYKVTGYVKTENIEGKRGSAGAGFSLSGVDFSGGITLQNTNDWTLVEMEFDSESEDSFMMECWLGKGGEAKGTAYFDFMRLEEISAQTLAPEISFDIKKKGEHMSPLLYGQFIEHMGRSIYGGLWAEMLTDRKFYYIPGTKKSPWTISIDSADISLDKSKTFAQANLPVISASGQVSLIQRALFFEAGKKYEGRLVFKASSGIKKLSVYARDSTEILIHSQDVSGSDFQTVPFSFVAPTSTENGEIKLNFMGDGKVTLAAVSLMPSDNVNGFRVDVLTLLKELNSPVYRWPGGNFVSGYNWKDGIGDPDKRPTQFDKAWNGLEYNDVGIDEFMNLCRLLGAEANIAVNTGLGTAEMAAEEVEYVNGESNTKMGRWRKSNGNTEPYKVRLWAIGNEMFGDWQLGHMPIEDYVKKHNQVAKAMKAVDPDIDLIAVGFPGKWNDMMYTYSADHMDYISEHFYRQDWHAGGLMTHVKQIPEAIRSTAEEHKKQRKQHRGLDDKNIKIALDEWNYWYGKHVYGLLGTRYFLRDALGIAAGFNEFSRQSDIFYMANYAQTVNVIGAIKTTPTDSWLEGTGLTLKLYRAQFGSVPIKVKGAPEPLDVAATLTEDGNYLTLSVINPTHSDYPLKLNGSMGIIDEIGYAYTITGENDMVYNDEIDKHRISITEGKKSLTNGTLSIPKESAGIYKFRILQ